MDLGRVEILLEVALLSNNLALPRKGYFQQVYHIFVCFKKSPSRRVFMDPDQPNSNDPIFKNFYWVGFNIDTEESILPDMPGPRGKVMSTHFFVDGNHASNKLTRRSRTGILLFYNKALVIWHSMIQNGVEVSPFGSEFIDLKNSVELIKSLRYKLRMFGVPIEGPTIYFVKTGLFTIMRQPQNIN